MYLKPCSSTIVKNWILSHDRRLRCRFYHCVYSLEACTKGWWCLEQNDAGIASDVAIFIQEKRIQMKCPEEFSDTVDRFGRLHIALKYMSMLGKKFRFYVSDLKNISVYGLVRYINIFLKIFCHLTFPAPPRSPVSKINRHHQRFEWETTERN